MHFGIVCPPVPGHLQPMATLGRALIQRGHQVTLLGIPDAVTYASRAGLGFAPIGSADFPAGALDAYIDMIREVDLSTIRKGIRWARNMSIALCRDGSAQVRSQGIDALLVDQVQHEGSTISELTGVPFVSICNALTVDADPTGEVPPPFLAWGPAGGQALLKLRNQLGHWVFGQLMAPIVKTINQFRRRQGLTPLRRWDDATSKLAVICNATRSFDFNRAPRPYPFHYTGPYLEESRASIVDDSFPLERLDPARPLIYASLGTLHRGNVRTHREIAEACASLPVQLVITLGAWRGTEERPSYPGDPLVVPYAPQVYLMSRAAVSIVHGGMNSTMEALACGCPLLALPITSDQPAVAQRVLWSGAGEFIPHREVTAPRVRAALERLLHQPAYRARARQLQADIRSAGGLKRAAELIEQTLSGAISRPPASAPVQAAERRA